MPTHEYDYQHGHLCKHTHIVKSLQVEQLVAEMTDQPHADRDNSDQKPFQIGVVRPIKQTGREQVKYKLSIQL